MRRPLIILATSCGLIAQLHLPGTGGDKSAAGVSGGAASGASKAPEAPAGPGTKRVPEQANRAVSSAPGEPDGYVLKLGWAPGTKARFIVSSFEAQWPDGSTRDSCGKPKGLPGKVVKLATPYMRTAADAQREWNSHGACSGLAPEDYFTLMIQARVAVQLPVQLTSLEGDATASGEQIESYFAGANTAFPAMAFRAECASGSFVGVRVCFDRSLAARECRGASACGTTVRITSQSARP